MENKTDHISATSCQNSKSSDHRRKRINRMKAIIVVIVIVLLILPTIFCIILGIQVNRLQKQMKELVDIHSEYGLSYEDSGSIDYAYAAEKPSDANLNNNSTDTDNNATIQTDIIQTDSDLKLSDSEQSEVLKPDAVQTKEGTKESNLDPDQINTASKQEPDGIYAGKKVYLTFDDGPSIYTDEILDILAKYKIKATFFVIGKTDDSSKDLYKRIVNEGHALGMHSYSHKYEKIYNSVEDFDKDFTKLWKLLYDTTGYKPSIYRFPGGSDNLVNKNGMEDFINYLNDNSIVYFDWNVVSGDATGVEYTADQLIDNVLGGIALKNTSIVLMHDSQTKKKTVESLPGLLEKLIAGGAQILPLDKDVPPIQMIKANSIK